MDKKLFNIFLQFILGVALLIFAGKISLLNSLFSHDVQVILGIAMIVFAIISFIILVVGKNSGKFASYFSTITGFLFLIAGFWGMRKSPSSEYPLGILAIGMFIFLKGFPALLYLKLPNHRDIPMHQFKYRRLMAYIAVAIMGTSLLFIPPLMELLLIPLGFIFLLFLLYGGGFRDKTIGDRLPLYITIFIFMINLLLLIQVGDRYNPPSTIEIIKNLIK